MLHSIVFSLNVSLTSITAIPVYTNLNGFKGMERKKMLPDRQIASLTTPGIMTCSRACLFRRRCQCFNFNVNTGECQLNSRTIGSNTTVLLIHNNYLFSDISHMPERLAGACASHTCPLNSVCQPVNKTHHVCKVTFCLDIPPVANGHFSKKPDASLLGTILPLVCDPGYMPQGDVTCLNNGTWSSSVCESVSSCSMVTQYRPDSEDGEYWLRLINFDNYTTQIYCHNINTTSPKEFLSLPDINYGIYPPIMNYGCRGETELRFGCTGCGGEIWLNKIMVNVTNMKVFKADKTFANISHSECYLAYGQAFDCYTGDLDNCGEDVKGTFTLDLRRTGWRVGEVQEWEAFGTLVKAQINRQMNGTLVILRCGGGSGGCRPANGKLVLTPFPEGMGTCDT